MTRSSADMLQTAFSSSGFQVGSSSTTSASSPASTTFASTSTSNDASAGSNSTSYLSSVGSDTSTRSAKSYEHAGVDIDDLLFDGFSQDLIDFQQTGTAAATSDTFSLSQTIESQAPEQAWPDLLLDNADNDHHDDDDSSSSHDDVDHVLYNHLLDASQASQEQHDFVPPSQSSINDLPPITNEELEAALEALNLDEPVTFPAGASNSDRRTIIKEKLCDYATSIIIQLTLATTSDYVSPANIDEEDNSQQEESQYRMLQAKIAKRPPKPSYKSIELKLRNRHYQNKNSSFRTVRFPATLASTRQFTIILRLLDLLTDCLAVEVPTTLRDIYYRDVKLFGSQKVVDTLVDDIAATMGVRRRDLNVVAASKGLVHGHLQLQNDQGNNLDCYSGSTGHLIPPNETIISMHVDPGVRFVLVVEKEAVFQTLCSSGFTNDAILGKSILITGKGYPDVATRELAKALCDQLPSSVPVLSFVDADPHGLHIFLNYRNGSKAMSFDSTNLVAPRLQWIGLSADDMLSMSTGEDSHLPLSPHDFKRGLSLLRAEGLDDNIRRHLQHMLHSRVKAEIQLLHSDTQNTAGLLHYLREKIPQYLPSWG